MTFKSAGAFGYTITLPFGRHSYAIQSPPVEVGYRLIETTQAAARAQQLLEQANDLAPNDPRLVDLQMEIEELQASLVVGDNEQDDYLAQLLGPAYEQMKANQEPWELVKLAAATVSVWVISSREDAEVFWNSGGRRQGPNSPSDRKTRATSK